MDVGAYHPILSSVTHRLFLRGWSGLSIDASSISERSFRKKRPHHKFVRAVVGQEDGISVPFYLSSPDTDFSQINTKFPKNEGFRSVQMNQVNLDSELKRNGINRVDVLSLDIEGSELEALHGLSIEIWNPSVVVVEIHSRDLHEALETKVSKFLLEHGYRLVASCVITHFFVKVHD